MTDTLNQEIARAMQATEAARDNDLLTWELEDLATAALSVVQPRIERLTQRCGEQFSEDQVVADGWDFASWEQGFSDAIKVVETRLAALTHKETEA